MILNFADSLDEQLTGRVLGRKHFGQVCDLLASVPKGSTVCFDFSGVKLVTGSWLNAMVVPFWRSTADDHTNLFPILCNASADWLDELRLVAEWNHQCYLVGSGRRKPPRRALLIGSLDPAQRTCLDAVAEAGEVTGAALERERPDEKIGATAWNNRLKDLFQKRLIQREKRGREQVYFPVVREIRFDG